MLADLRYRHPCKKGYTFDFETFKEYDEYVHESPPEDGASVNKRVFIMLIDYICNPAIAKKCMYLSEFVPIEASKLSDQNELNAIKDEIEILQQTCYSLEKNEVSTDIKARQAVCTYFNNEIRKMKSK